MIILNSLEEVRGKVIRKENPYVKVLNEPKFNIKYKRWECLAQVDGCLAIISLTVTKQYEQ